jgi:hypothetical protein
MSIGAERDFALVFTFHRNPRSRWAGKRDHDRPQYALRLICPFIGSSKLPRSVSLDTTVLLAATILLSASSQVPRALRRSLYSPRRPFSECTASNCRLGMPLRDDLPMLDSRVISRIPTVWWNAA